MKRKIINFRIKTRTQYKKKKHDGDCSVYFPLGESPEAGICTCGYGHQLKGESDFSEMYSEELEQQLLKNNPRIPKKSKLEVEKLFKK